MSKYDFQSIPFREIQSIEKHANGFSLRTKTKSIPLSFQNDEERNVFVQELKMHWDNIDRGARMKAFEDYAADPKKMGWIWLIITVSFPVMATLILLSDGIHTMNCTKKLHLGKIVPAELLKIKKNRRGNFIWRVSFQTLEGQVIQGTREASVTTPDGHPNGKLTVVYAPEDLTCWDVSLQESENAINLKQRMFTETTTLTFGIAFAIISLIFGWITLKKFRNRNPYWELFLNS